MDYLTEIKATIARLYCSGAKHVGSVPVAEIRQGRLVWTEEVEIFELTGHAKTKRCYAWRRPKTGGGWDIIAVLEIPPVVSPRTAVKSTLAEVASGLSPAPA